MQNIQASRNLSQPFHNYFTQISPFYLVSYLVTPYKKVYHRQKNVSGNRPIEPGGKKQPAQLAEGIARPFFIGIGKLPTFMQSFMATAFPRFAHGTR